MEAQVKRIKDVTVVSIAGRLHIDHSLAFRKNSMLKLRGHKVAFALAGLQFVGSNGIQSFFRCLIELSQDSGTTVRVVGLHKDFRRLFSAEEWARVLFHDDLDSALTHFELPVPAVAPVTVLPDFAQGSAGPVVVEDHNSNSASEKSMRSAA